jgi:hypothetical protein
MKRYSVFHGIQSNGFNGRGIENGKHGGIIANVVQNGQQHTVVFGTGGHTIDKIFFVCSGDKIKFSDLNVGRIT